MRNLEVHVRAKNGAEIPTPLLCHDLSSGSMADSVHDSTPSPSKTLDIKTAASLAIKLVVGPLTNP